MPRFLFYFIMLTLTFLACKSPKKITEESLIHQPFDAIIVPGCPFEGQEWSAVMKQRVYWAKYMYDNGFAKNVIFSGSAVYTPFYESKIMGIYAKAIGIDSAHIFYESEAEHSTENIYYSLKIAKSNDFSNVGLATDPFQSRMLKRFIRKRKLGIKHLPINYEVFSNVDMYTPKIDSKSAFCDTFVSIKERETRLERWRGTRGKHINWNK